MTKQEPELKNARAMLRFASFNMMLLLSAFLSAGIAKAQTATDKSKVKRDYAVFIDQSMDAGDGGNPETGIVVYTKKGKTSAFTATFIDKNGVTQMLSAGRDLFKNGKFIITGYGGWRGDFKKTGNTQRLFGGVGINATQPLNEDRSLVVNVLFNQIEENITPNKKWRFFSAGQVFVKEAKGRFRRFRYGVEHSFRKDEGGTPSLSFGPMVGVQLNKRTRVEGWLYDSNTGPPRFRIRTVFAF